MLRSVYTFIIYLLIPFVLFRLFWLGFKSSGYWSRWYERFGFFFREKGIKPVIWFHTVSVGEVNAAKIVICDLLDKYPQYSILVTTVTPTGMQTVKRHFKNKVEHRYFPYDLPFVIKSFIEKISPKLIVVMETEIWPNLYHFCNKKNIPVLLVNARLSEKSANQYRLVSRLMYQTLNKVDLILAQSKKDANRFISFGISREKVIVTGNVKFDIHISHSISKQAESLKSYFSVDRPIWMAASTREGENETVLDAHLKILEKYPSAILIIAPRHLKYTGQIENLCHQRNLQYVKKTEYRSFTENFHVYLLNVLGELQPNYAVSQVAFVGGSLVNTGGQNTLEPASLGIPVLSGPHTYNFTEISEILHEADVLHYVHSASELATEVCRLFADVNLQRSIGEKGRKLVESNKGNINRLMKLLQSYLVTDAS